MPIPIARFLQVVHVKIRMEFCRKYLILYNLAFSNVADLVLPTAPKPTPTAKPSGMLCTVMATMSRRILRQWSSLRRISEVSARSTTVIPSSAESQLAWRCRRRKRAPLPLPPLPKCCGLSSEMGELAREDALLSSSFAPRTGDRDRNSDLKNCLLGVLAFQILLTHIDGGLHPNPIHDDVGGVYKTAAQKEAHGCGDESVLAISAVRARLFCHLDGGLEERPV